MGDAQQALINIRQKKNWTVDVYAAEFQRHAVHTKWPDSSLIKHFEQGLQQRMKDMLRFCPNMPTTFPEYVRSVAMIESCDRQLTSYA